MIAGGQWKKLLLLATTTATLTGCASMQRPAESIESVERARFVAMTRQDIAALDPVLAPDLSYCHSNGTCEDKIHFLETIQTGGVRYKEMNVEQIRARPVDRNTYVLTGTVGIKGEQAGQPIAFRVVYTDIYVNRDGRWQLLAWQSTRLP
jgi:hypothetical protein